VPRAIRPARPGSTGFDSAFIYNTFSPLVLAPGQSGTILVTITPGPTMAGKTVTGFIYVDTFNQVVFTGDEIVSLPYSYTVTK
jgi:hypothetical protein